MQEVLFGPPEIGQGGRQGFFGGDPVRADAVELLFRERLVVQEALRAGLRGPGVVELRLGFLPVRHRGEVLGPHAVEVVTEDAPQHGALLHPVPGLHQHLGHHAVHDGAHVSGAPLVEAHNPEGLQGVGPGDLPRGSGDDPRRFASRRRHGDDAGRGIGGGRRRRCVVRSVAAGDPEQEREQDGAVHGRGASPSASRAVMAAPTASMRMSFSIRRASA